MTLSTPALQDPASLARGGNIITIASGKGGVGKTWLAITLAHALARAGRRALLFDGDIGLANVDIQLGRAPERDLGSVIAGRFTLRNAVIPFADGGFDIIAGRSGSGHLSALHPTRLAMLRDGLVEVSGGYDDVVVDLGAGRCLVVCTDEPTSMTDAYAFLKIVRRERPEMEMPIAVNMASSRRDGENTFNVLRKVCENFLGHTPPLAGIVRSDSHVRDAIRNQTVLLTRHPDSPASADVEALAATLGSGR